MKKESEKETTAECISIDYPNRKSFNSSYTNKNDITFNVSYPYVYCEKTGHFEPSQRSYIGIVSDPYFFSINNYEYKINDTLSSDTLSSDTRVCDTHKFVFNHKTKSELGEDHSHMLEVISRLDIFKNNVKLENKEHTIKEVRILEKHLDSALKEYGDLVARVQDEFKNTITDSVGVLPIGVKLTSEI